MTEVAPGLVLLVGALILPLLVAPLRRLAAVALAVGALVAVAVLPEGARVGVPFWGQELVLLEVDRLSLVFGWIFAIAALGWTIFSWALDDRAETTAGLMYAGASLLVVFAGDLLTVFLGWELMALTSAVVVASGGHARARRATFRYLMVHLLGGVLLLFGIVMRWNETGSLAVGPIDLDGLGSWLVLVGVGINAGLPPLWSWVADAYPEASPTGTVLLSAFTTKTAVYVLATLFAGEPVLIGAGLLMALYGIVYALNENDARRVLSYSIVNQVGFMVCGIGIGTELALNGVAAHAFCHILYKALLLMTAGAVYLRTGHTKCTELGGLWRSMPVTLTFAVIGAASISSLPLTSGFVSKSMILSAAAEAHLTVPYLLLLTASAGVALHAGIKFPYFVFFATDRGLRPAEAPRPMLLAMGLLAALCVGLGVYPRPLYDLLPTPVTDELFVPYTLPHVSAQLQLLMASGVAFTFMLPFLKRTETLSLDLDWFYRRGGRAFYRAAAGPLVVATDGLGRLVHTQVPRALAWFVRNPPEALRVIWARMKLAGVALVGGAHRWDRARVEVADREQAYAAVRPAALFGVNRTALYLMVALFFTLSAYLLS